MEAQVLYPVSNISYGLRVGGTWSGTATVFVRLSGCNAGCPFCDADRPPQLWLTPEQITGAINQLVGNRRPVIVLTGGEPTVHDLEPLARAIGEEWPVHLETNGLKPVAHAGLYNWVTVSPKRPYVSGQDYAATEFIFIMTADGWLVDPAPYLEAYPHVDSFIQPLRGSLKAWALAARRVKENPCWRINPQCLAPQTPR